MTQSQTTPKLYLTAFLLALSTLLPPRAHALNFSLTLDGLYSRDLTGASRHKNAIGGNALFEIEPTDFISLGVGAHLNNYWGVVTQGPLWASSVDGVIRLMPWGLRNNIESYLLFGGGINTLKGQPLYGWGSWNGDYHFQLGVGLRYFISPHFAIDGAVGGDYYDPFDKPLTDLTARFGLSFYALPAYQEPTKEKEDVVKPKPQHKVGSLQYVAMKEYGDPDLYPVLVDANFKDLGKPLILPKGAQLIIPRNLTKDMILEAHQRAHSAKYLNAAASFDNPTLTAHYKEKNRKALAAIPITQQRKTSFPYSFGDSLWDIAARSDVYGDPELYPLLLDANRARLRKSESGLKFGLTIPREVSHQDIVQARIKAWAVEYILWRGKNVNHRTYQEWRRQHHLSPEGAEPKYDPDQGD